MAIALGRAGVDVTGEVGHLHQVVELVGDEGDERVAEVVGRPVLAQAGPGNRGGGGPAQVRHRHRGAGAGAEDEGLGVVLAEQSLLVAMALEGGDEERWRPIRRRLREVLGAAWPT